VEAEDAVAFDHGGRSYAVYLTEDGGLYCTDGLCPADGAHLAGGVLDGDLIECPNHGGAFDIRDGSVAAGPACDALRAYPVRRSGDWIEVDLSST
jgi:3-phenylpropionate/trans-cinnamate dioxygenase ferredoxin subunit